MTTKGNGRLFIISAPSGAGKTTIVKGALQKLTDMRLSVSWTTRNPRNGEVDGRDYIFVSREDFEALIKKDGLIEWAKVFEEYYGTPKENLKKAKDDHVDLFLVIDVQGAMQIRKKLSDAVLIFVMPPSIEVLKTRLNSRGNETPQEIDKRVKEAEREIKESEKYDYKIVNDKLEDAINELTKIVTDERAKKP